MAATVMVAAERQHICIPTTGTQPSVPSAGICRGLVELRPRGAIMTRMVISTCCSQVEPGLVWRQRSRASTGTASKTDLVLWTWLLDCQKLRTVLCHGGTTTRMVILILSSPEILTPVPSHGSIAMMAEYSSMPRLGLLASKMVKRFGETGMTMVIWICW